MNINSIDKAVELRRKLDEAKSQAIKVKTHDTKCVVIDKGDFNCDITIFTHDDEALVSVIEKAVIDFYERKAILIRAEIEAL